MKQWWKSKTLWFNALVAAATAAEASLSLLQPVLGAGTYPSIAFALALGNAVLRVMTTQGLGK